MIYGEGEDRAFVEELLVTIADRVRQAPRATSERKSECFIRVAPIDRRIRRSIEVMHSRLSEHIGLETLARSVGLSRQHFFDLFRRCTTLTAERLLEHAAHGTGGGPSSVRGLRPIHDIAADLGFSAQSNFARFFRDHQGVSPRAYRNAVVTVDELASPETRRVPGPLAPLNP